MSSIRFRDQVTTEDVTRVGRLVTATGFFRTDEIDVAVELVAERLARGPECGYEFLFAEQDGHLLGYTCFGPIPCTLGSFDIYWIAVDPDWQRQGIGRQLLAATERTIMHWAGRAIYIETSNRPQYASTRVFYESCGYSVVAILPDFYDVGDDKVVLWKGLAGG